MSDARGSKDEELNVGESRDRHSDSERDAHTGQKVSHASASTTNETAGASQRGLPTPTAVNEGQDKLVNELLSTDLKSMYNDMAGKTDPLISSKGSNYRPPTSEEAWRPLENLGNTVPSHGSSSLPHPSQQKKPSAKKPSAEMPPANNPNLLDRHNKIMAAILTRFRNMVIAATEPIPTAGAIPYASLNVMTMNNETSALVCISLL